MWLIPHTNTSSFGRLIGRGIGGEEVVAVSIRMEIDSGQPMMVVFRLWGTGGRIWVVTLFSLNIVLIFKLLKPNILKVLTNYLL